MDDKLHVTINVDGVLEKLLDLAEALVWLDAPAVQYAKDLTLLLILRAKGKA